MRLSPEIIIPAFNSFHPPVPPRCPFTPHVITAIIMRAAEIRLPTPLGPLRKM